MIPTPLRLISAQRLEEMGLLEQVHEALGSASNLQEFYMIAAGLLITPSAFNFDRAFILRYHERERVYVGKLLVGGNTKEQHLALTSWLDEENKVLLALSQDSEPKIEGLDLQARSTNLAQHTLWIHLLQLADEAEWFDTDFLLVRIPADSLPANHIIHRLAQSSTPMVINGDECACVGLEPFIRFPAVAGRLATKHGLHALIFADSSFKSDELALDDLIHFQWLVNHASVTLSNVELVEELTLSSLRLQEMDKLKSSFLSIVSHELRTPLTSVIGFTHLLREGRGGVLNEQQLDLVTRISQHSNRLEDMVNDLLELAEIETGGMVRVDLQPTNPFVALANAIPKVHARHPQKGVEIVGIAKAGTHPLLCDKSTLERIFLHLLDNAVKFSPAGARVTVDIYEEWENICIAIEDKGIGISEENRLNIFNQFYQVDYRLERAFGGLGIGLNVVRLLLEATGGRLTLESKVDEGSCFTVVYPRATVQANAELCMPGVA